MRPPPEQRQKPAGDPAGFFFPAGHITRPKGKALKEFANATHQAEREIAPLPAEIRSQLRLRPGDLLEITAEGKEISIRKAPQSYVQALETCISKRWQGYEPELDQTRDQ